MNSIFTEENLLAFTTAARFGSFSKAAEELGLTTSAISYTIKRMETGLDVVLFTRSTRSIELTESGRYFFRKATDLLNDFHAIKRSIDIPKYCSGFINVKCAMAQHRNPTKRMTFQVFLGNVLCKRINFLRFIRNAFFVQRHPRDAIVDAELIATEHNRFFILSD